MNIYDECPVLENDKYLLRQVENYDCDDLLDVYSDKNSLAFFNSDNCDGDNFYYETKYKMQKAIDFWNYAYANKWFARMAIIDKNINKAIGTVELCLPFELHLF